MNNVLITGLGIASDLGLCDACNLDFSWLFSNLSVVLWADSIMVPKQSFEKLRQVQESKDEKAIGLFLDLAENHGLIKKIDISSTYQGLVGEQIYSTMQKNSEALMSTFPESIRKGSEGVPDEIIIGDEGYCGAWMSSIYAGLKVASDFGANCLFGEREHIFLKYLYGIHADIRTREIENKIYSEVFSLFMPESMSIHNYAFINEEKCETCKNIDRCRNIYLIDTEESLEEMFRWKEYDELQQAKDAIDKIISFKDDVSSQKDIDDIKKEFRSTQDKINKNINRRFPKIERWTRMTTVLATPITIASAITGNIPITIGGTIATGLAQAAENLMEVYKSKNNWVGFVNDMKNERL